MDGQLYNLNYLQEVFQGNDAMVCRILDLFELEVPGYFEEMAVRLAQGQWKDLHPLAHKAKSSLGMLGMTDVLQHILYIESVSRGGLAPQDIETRLKAAKAELDLAIGALSADRETLNLVKAARLDAKAKAGLSPGNRRGLKRA